MNPLFLKFERFQQQKPYTLSLRRNHKHRLLPRLSTTRAVHDKDFASISFDAIQRATLYDLERAVVWFGRTPLRQIKGAPMGSPTSVLAACLVAVYLEQKNWAILRQSCISLINQQRHVFFYRKRWIDDIYVIIASELPLTEHQITEIRRLFGEAYFPFGVKVEDANIFVGLRVSTIPGKLSFHVSTRNDISSTEKIPLFVHSKSNISQRQVRGLIKGALTRVLDGAIDSSVISFGVQNLVREFALVGHHPRLIKNVVRSLIFSYPYPEPAFSNVQFILCEFSF